VGLDLTLFPEEVSLPSPPSHPLSISLSHCSHSLSRMDKSFPLFPNKALSLSLSLRADQPLPCKRHRERAVTVRVPFATFGIPAPPIDSCLL